MTAAENLLLLLLGMLLALQSGWALVQ